MRQDPDDLDAWSNAQRGWWHFNQETKEDNAKARTYFERAIELDPLWGWPHAGLALAHFKDAAHVWTDAPEQSVASLLSAAQRAVELDATDASGVELDATDASGHHALGHAYSMSGQSGKMIAAFQRGAELNPSDAIANKCLGAHLALVGQPEEAVRHLDRAISISPQDPRMFGFLANMSWAHFAAEQYEAALEWAEKSIQQRPNPHAYQVAAASLAHLGRIDRAQASLQELLRLQPDLSREGLEHFFAAAESDFLERLIAGLRQAGWDVPRHRKKRGPSLRM
jgi:tetratricopeptide (TPR) repeat protein